MKKQDIVDLIDAHLKNNNACFINKAYDIARYFYDSGDTEIANYLLSQLNPSLVMSSQSSLEQLTSSFFKEISYSSNPFVLPDSLSDQLKGIVNAVNKNIGINKFLFVGKPGTGKTEAARQIGRVLKRKILMINFDTLVDSRLGMTAKNITSLFEEINRYALSNRVLFLFDEIDSIVLDRINRNDVREMGRATSTFLRGLDSLSESVLLIATTNLQKQLDQALKRRFDALVDFDCYSTDDLFAVGLSYIDTFSKGELVISRDSRLLKKIIATFKDNLTPGKIRSYLRTSIAFSDEGGEDYLRRFYNLCKIDFPEFDDELVFLKDNGFTYREMEILTPFSKSELARRMVGE